MINGGVYFGGDDGVQRVIDSVQLFRAPVIANNDAKRLFLSIQAYASNVVVVDVYVVVVDDDDLVGHGWCG